ncbi:hypothetical protein C4A77_24230 [Brevibacillus laterosporus]|uniref:Uncharacterized protein n=1 Tax=Brevibacillus laterosporus TaxID=1465 RepID=A0AAP8Q8P3_BRELA|nr:hypothetical protein C4A77_24230 [Brevibacillus laterosporus]
MKDRSTRHITKVKLKAMDTQKVSLAATAHTVSGFMPSLSNLFSGDFQSYKTRALTNWDINGV